MMGAERRSMAMTEEEKKLTAYHEAGHALVGLSVRATTRCTRSPSSRAAGRWAVMATCPSATAYHDENEMEACLAMVFGGRVAEELIFGPDNVTTGAANDIKQATDMARSMVMEYGMSEKLGRMRYARKPGGGVPRPFGGPSPEHLRGDSAADRCRDAGAWSMPARPRRARC